MGAGKELWDEQMTPQEAWESVVCGYYHNDRWLNSSGEDLPLGEMDLPYLENVKRFLTKRPEYPFAEEYIIKIDKEILRRLFG